MSTRDLSGLKGFFLSIFIPVLALLMCEEVFAKIPEPDNIIYGIARADAVTIKLEVQGRQIASYKMGDNPDAGIYYILRVPMDTLEPAEPGSARIGELARIFVNDETVPAASVTLGERGTIHRHDLGLAVTDWDGDGLPDEWEQQIIDAKPDDDIKTLGDVLRDDDFDGDGESNFKEWQYGSSPIDAMSARCGDMDGDKYVSLADAILALQVTCRMETSASLSTIGDANGDGRIGPEEAIYITKKLSAAR